MYKILALDLDGTLLNKKHEVSAKNREMIEKIKEKGIKIILLSGREPGSVKYYSEQLGLEEILSGFNGGIITDNKGEKIYFNQCLQEELAKETIFLSEKMNMCNVVFIGNKLYTQDKKDSRFKTFEKYTLVSIEEVGCLSTFLEKNKLWSNINKILLTDDNKILNECKDILEEKVDNGLTMQFSLPFFLEIFSKDISKGGALEEISKLYKVNKEEIIAIGDGENDITMIQYAGLGVAMDNAPENVKEIADFITLSNEEDGVSSVIKKFIVNK
ncbi:Cof-type HAD-IIB family hydrolase [Tissierella sp. MSJ-40]|uniref:Cof-type HAD-IIB family hydrolase n=1 Tax=Tissierella simiarum TaxID=2841534 RepID=A0ABS6E8C9_9FIRM|nr:HAD family hydrolase [Tissierella simiarum]MBU5439091.1 Cof-type HAD-IIB family hydrolase [Tissierella simiarum]